MTTPSSSPLPPLYSAWMTELLGGEPPNEKNATCDNCAMCNSVAPDAIAFNPQTKCCTYLPLLPNFLVGQILADEDPAFEVGRASLRTRIATGMASTPLGVGVPESYGILYQHSGPRVFGQSVAMRCPHYIEDGGRCGVWRHRNSVCATWFCKHVRGEVGLVFWESVRELLTAIERDLALWCIRALDIGADALPSAPRPGAEGGSLSAAELDRRSDPEKAAAVWGNWAGREVELYRACGALVAGLDFGGVLRHCGPEVSLRIEMVRAAWTKLATFEVPERLRVGRLVVARMSRSKPRVTTYSGLDPVEMPRSLFDALPMFDGRATGDARRDIIAEGGPRLSDGLVRKRTDFAVLVPADTKSDHERGGS